MPGRAPLSEEEKARREARSAREVFQESATTKLQKVESEIAKIGGMTRYEYTSEDIDFLEARITQALENACNSLRNPAAAAQATAVTNLFAEA